MEQSQSLARRAMLAVALTAGFYLLALAIAGTLLFIPYAEWTYGGRLHIKIALFCIIGAGVILWSIMPRIDRFTPPGPQLLPEEHPELFAVLRQTARETQQEMPAEVYAVGEMNAWVMDRGGFLGFGSRRVMGLGLPLLRVLNISQARGVIAHEFGHFYGGDTKLGPWIYRTRSAIGRTLNGLEGVESMLQKPFEWYGNAFMRITQGISRGQEYSADRLAAGIVGTEAMVEGLRIIHGSAPVFDSYWRNEYLPALNQGYHPPLSEGFATFMSVPSIAEAVTNIITEELDAGETNIYDSHPSLRDRVAALQTVTFKRDQDTRPAISLLKNVEQLEASFVQRLVNPESGHVIQPIAWENVGGKVWLPIWEDHANTYSDILKELRLGAIPQLLADEEAKRALLAQSGEVNDEGRERFLVGVLGSAIAVVLARQGWQLEVNPGADVVLKHEGKDIKPFAAVKQMVAGEMAKEEWGKICAEAGIGNEPLVLAPQG